MEFQPNEARLLIDGQPAALGRRALVLLWVLVERPNHLISMSDLLDQVSPEQARCRHRPPRPGRRQSRA